MDPLTPITPDDELEGKLRTAVEEVRRESVSDDLVVRCTVQAAQIPRLDHASPVRAGSDRLNGQSEKILGLHPVINLIEYVSVNRVEKDAV